VSTAFADPILLLVEPSAMQAKYIVQSCKELGLERVRLAGSAAEALISMRDLRPDVVISALYLPDMTGTDLIVAMRNEADLAGVPFILISSETRPQALDPVRQAGVCGILPKPFTTKQLSRALDTTIDYLAAEQGEAMDFRTEELRVLLVDDSSSARKFMRRLLENLGIMNFIEAENGSVAASILADTMVDLVITDYNMPEMDGKGLVDFIRQQSWQASVPILMVTSEDDMGRLAAIESAGVSGICDKPFEAHVVRELLGRLLANRNADDNDGNNSK
jgi:two-component system chemotaxis response regulator CheY